MGGNIINNHSKEFTQKSSNPLCLTTKKNQILKAETQSYKEKTSLFHTILYRNNYSIQNVGSKHRENQKPIILNIKKRKGKEEPRKKIRVWRDPLTCKNQREKQ